MKQFDRYFVIVFFFTNFSLSARGSLFIEWKEFLNRRNVARNDFQIVKNSRVGDRVNGVCDVLKAEARGTVTKVDQLILKKNSEAVYTHTSKKISQAEFARHWKFSLKGYDVSGNSSNAGTIRFNFTIPKAKLADSGVYSCWFVQDATESVEAKRSGYKSLDLYVHDTKSNPCRDDWIYYYREELCLFISHKTLTWDDAKEECSKRYRGLLAQPSDTNYDNFLTSLLGANAGRSYWIGMSDKESGGNFKWIKLDLALKNSDDYENWGQYPVDAGKHANCVEKGGLGNGTWGASQCSDAYRFICQRSTGVESDSPLIWKLLEVAVITTLGLAGVVVLVMIFIVFIRKTVVSRYIGGLKTGSFPESECTTTSGSQKVILMLYDSDVSPDSSEMSSTAKLAK